MVATTIAEMLQLEFTVIQVSPPSSQKYVQRISETEAGHGSAWVSDLGEHQERRPALEDVSTWQRPPGGPELRISSHSVGLPHEGWLVAASSRPDFPTRADLALLAACANQTATALQNCYVRQALKCSEARLKAAIELAGLSLYSWNPTTDALQWDDRLREIWGLAPGAHVDREAFLAGLHPEDRPRVEAAILACVDPEGDGIYALDYRVTGSGAVRWVSTHGQTRFEDGRPVGFVGAALDITERKQAEERLRLSEERFRRFAEHSANMLWILNAEIMSLEYLSPAFETIWGRSPETMLQKLAHWTEAIHPDDRTAVNTDLHRVMTGEIVVQEYRICRPDGTVRALRNTSFPIRDDQGRIRRVGGIAEDITKHNGFQVYVVNTDEASRNLLSSILGHAGYDVNAFASGPIFLDVAPILRPGCVVLDVRTTEAQGLAVLRELKARTGLPVITIGISNGDVGIAVRLMKAGAVDWLEMPYEKDALLAAVASALAGIRDTAEADQPAVNARSRIARFSSREREVLCGLLAGETNKEIARRLGISPRTVEVHRAHVMERLGARTLSQAIQMAVSAGLQVPPGPSGRSVRP